MNDETCPQCLRPLSGYSLRLVQDSCGHKKCRMCLLLDENGCRTCEINAFENPSKSKNDEPLESLPKENPIPSQIESQPIPENDQIACSYHAEQIEAPDEELPQEVIKQTSDSVSYIETQSNSDQLPSHITIFQKSPITFQCQKCNKIFSSRFQIKRHSNCGVIASSENNTINKNLACKECGQQFARKSHLEWHVRRHTGERPFVCSICTKSFTQKSKLNRHSILHTDNKPYECKVCEKKFRTKDGLQNHIKTHTGEKPFKCSKCTSRFSELSNLKKHQTVHTKERPFMCSDCGARFSLKWRLTVHTRVHSRERPHICSQCPRGFNNMKDLRRHEVIHSDVKPFSCKYCSTLFRRKDNLERHIKNTHLEAGGKSAEKHFASNSSQSVSNSKPKKTEKVASDKNSILLPENNNLSVIESTNNIEKLIFNSQKSVITLRDSYLNDTALPISSVDDKPKPNAVSVINGPVKLALKTKAFKTNYNIKRKELDVDHNVDIYKRILSPMTSSKPKDKNIEVPIRNPDSIIKSLNSINEPNNDLIKHKMAPISVPRIHYETSFENGQHAIIKNIKFKLPPDYTARLSKFNSQLNESATDRIDSNENEVLEYPAGGNYDNQTYTTLTPVQFDHFVQDKDNCVRTITKNSTVSNQSTIEFGNFQDEESYIMKDTHWRRRTSQILQPKLNNSY